jgi:meso-butanediol dehydrogenase/(S,S)-butanediol dehydrogenase/diacetyl reductase
VVLNPIPTTCQRFRGSVALVTGAGHGIGRACALRLADEGARVAVTDRDLDAAAQTLESTTEPRRHAAVELDVRDRTSVDEALQRVVEQLGQLDVLVNVAGGDTEHPAFEDTDDAVWAAMLDLNLVGVVRCCRAAIPHLRRSAASPAIVTVSSVNGSAALGSEPYSSAKAGVGVLTMNLAAQLGPDGVRVNAVAPATVRTRNWDSQPGGADRMRPLYPLGRVGEPEDVAAAVAFLASTDAAWITGQTLVVDGGMSVRSPFSST